MSLSVAAYLAFKELWRRRGRYLLVSLVSALITLIVIFLNIQENVELMLRLNGTLDAGGEARANGIIERPILGERLHNH